MHTYILKSVALLVVAVALAVVPVRAQGHHPLRVEIPFSFVVGHTTLSKGTYIVSRTSLAGNALVIRSISDDESAVVLTSGRLQAFEATSARLVFNQYGGKHFLSQVWTDGGLSGRQIAISDSERDLARQDTETEQVTVLVKPR